MNPERRAYESGAHPHVPAGSASGGQFAPKSSSPPASQKAKKKAPARPAAKASAKKPDDGILSYDGTTGTGYGTPGGDPRVHRLQQALNRLGVTDGNGDKLKDDGKLGPKTTAAVKRAQRRLGVPEDGKVTPALLDQLAKLQKLPRRRFFEPAAEVRTPMSTASINDLPDSAFAYVEPGGHKDDQGKTVPIHDAAHVRDALSRAPQSPFGDKALPKIRAAAEKFGIQVNDSGRSADFIEEGGGGMAAVERRFTNVTVELRTVGDGPARVGGYAAKFNLVSNNLGGFVEVVERSFFNKSRGDGWPSVMCRYNHDDNMLLGTSDARTLMLSVDETGLDYQVIPPSTRADVVELVQRGDVRKSSFAFRLPSDGDEWTMSEQGYPLRKLHTGQLVDVAPVNAPAYMDTTVGLRSLDPAEVRKLGLGPAAAYESLARRMDADPEEVRAAAEENELRRFFVTVSSAAMPKPKPRTLGAAALVALMAKREDPWE